MHTSQMGQEMAILRLVGLTVLHSVYELAMTRVILLATLGVKSSAKNALTYFEVPEHLSSEVRDRDCVPTNQSISI